MTIDGLQFFLDKAFGATGLIVLGFFMKYYFDNVHQRISDIQSSNEAKFDDIVSRINSIQNKYQDVLDIVLTKFTNWEDRISGLLAKAQTMDKDQMLKEIENFKRQNQDDLSIMKLEISRVKDAVKATSFESEYVERLRSLENQLAARIRGSEERLNLCVKMISHLNEKSKQFEFKIENLSAINKAKGNPKA